MRLHIPLFNGPEDCINSDHDARAEEHTHKDPLCYYLLKINT